MKRVEHGPRSVKASMGAGLIIMSVTNLWSAEIDELTALFERWCGIISVCDVIRN